MVFSSLTFICIFLPCTFLMYTLIPNLKIKNIFLVLISLLFYAYGEPVYVFLMIFSIIVNYILGIGIGNDNSKKKFLMILAIIINLGLLSVFKYSSFAVETLNSLLKVTIHKPKIRLPIGISFYTFQSLSYIVDVYRKNVKPQKNLGKMMLYISFFPQLIAGPIVKYHDINQQIDNRKQSSELVAKGLRRFILGLSKKVLIANTMASVADSIFALQSDNLNILSAWLGAVAYLMQIYYDFSGYSDMAIGLGMMFGFRFKENFNYPYSADSIKDFWRRWHISLSTWFKEYLYIPLGGNRKGKARTYFNKIFVFLCTGLWHGANWTFIIWGLYHGFFLLLEGIMPRIKCPKILRHLYTIIVVCIGFVIFRSDNITYACKMIKTMFQGNNFNFKNMNVFWSQITPLFILTLILAIVFAMPVKKAISNVNMHLYAALNKLYSIFSIVLLGLCLLNLAGGTYNPFIYFRF